jgi:hypothetical protein
MAAEVQNTMTNLSAREIANQDSARERVRYDLDNIEHDVVGWTPGTTLVDRQLFQAVVKPAEYQSNPLPVADGQIKAIAALSATHDILFATSGREAADQNRFERDSYILIKVDGKEYPRVPVSALMPHTISRQGTGFTFVPKLSPWYKMKRPISLKGKKDVSVKLVVAAGLATAAAGAATPLWPDLITNGSTTAYAFSLMYAGPVETP